MAFPDPVSCVDAERELLYAMWGISPGWTRTRRGPSNYDCLWSFDHVTRTWRKRECYADKQRGWNPPVDVGACCTMLDGKMYSFGGWLMGSCSTSVHELDLESMKWSFLEPANNDNLPLLKIKCGMVGYGSEMLLVFGGYGLPEEGVPLQSGARYEIEGDGEEFDTWLNFGWTNEIHLFHVKKRVWLVPRTTGTPPPPCAAFSFNKIDCHRVLLFGGELQQTKLNEIHILDMADWHWSGAITATCPLESWPVGPPPLPSSPLSPPPPPPPPLPQHLRGAITATSPQGPGPVGRSFHTACCLVDPSYVPLPENKEVPKHFDWLPCAPPDLGLPLSSSSFNIKEQRLLVLWGTDKNKCPIGDAWILNLSSLTWEKLSLPGKLKARFNHCSGAFYPTPAEAIVVLFGGNTSMFRSYRTNLITAENEDSLATQETVMFRFGVPNLTHLCQHWFVSHLEDLTPLHTLLPARVHQSLLELQTAQNRVKLTYPQYQTPHDN